MSHHVLNILTICTIVGIVPKCVGQWDNTLYYIFLLLNLYSKNVGKVQYFILSQTVSQTLSHSQT